MNSPEIQAPLLRLHDFAVEAGGGDLFRGLEFSLDESELLGVVGPSGCGKTTLLRAISGLADPSEGQVVFRGRPPSDHGWPSYRRQVVLVEQRPVLLEGTVRSNLERPFRYRTAQQSFPTDRARSQLERLGLEPNPFEQDARSLSVGQQQRVCLVRALLLNPAVLLLDEPTSALDADAAALVEDLLHEEREQNRLSALVVTHDRAQAERLCGRVLDLRGHGQRQASHAS